jgi:hypothetical protein
LRKFLIRQKNTCTAHLGMMLKTHDKNAYSYVGWQLNVPEQEENGSEIDLRRTIDQLDHRGKGYGDLDGGDL